MMRPGDEADDDVDLDLEDEATQRLLSTPASGWSPETTPGGAPASAALGAGRAPPRPGRKDIPWWAWPALAVSVLAVSSAGVTFRSLGNDHVPPLLLASWRLQGTVLFLLPGCIFQLWQMLPQDRARLVGRAGEGEGAWRAPLLLLLASGSCLAVHFGGWVWGIAHTTIARSLLYVSTSPVIIAGGTWLLRHPITYGELLGTAIGVVGAALIASGADAGPMERASLAGDAASLLGAVTIVGYLAAGRTLRQWLPLLVYVVPVTAVGAAWLAMASWGWELQGGGHHVGLLGWLDSRYLLRSAYLSLGPGVMGHTNINFLLKYMPPLAIGLAFNLEPMIGSVLGWAMSLSGVPSVLTWCGGVVLVVATSLVSVAAARREGDAAADDEMHAGRAHGDYHGVEMSTPLQTPGGATSPARGALVDLKDLFFSPATRRWAAQMDVVVEVEAPGTTPRPRGADGRQVGAGAAQEAAGAGRMARAGGLAKRQILLDSPEKSSSPLPVSSDVFTP